MEKALLFVCFWAIFSGCCPGKASQQGAAHPVREGITGFIYEESGNQMPMKGAEPQKAKGLSTTIYIYELTNLGQVHRVDNTPFYTAVLTRAVATAHSDSTGAFTIRLAPGSYSLFVKLGDRFYANNFDTGNNIAPVTVQKDKLSAVRFLVNPSAAY